MKHDSVRTSSRDPGNVSTNGEVAGDFPARDWATHGLMWASRALSWSYPDGDCSAREW